MLSGQVIDTSRMINTWRLMHNYTRFAETPLDTNMHQLQREYNPAYQRGFSYENLGILGHALNHVDFSLRPEPDAFLFGRSWGPYLKTADRTTFFNTKTPFTILSYSTIPVVDWREENVEAIHTQNMDPFTNFGIYFNILAGKELYSNEDTRVNRMGLFGSRARNRYSIFGTFYYNDFRVEDHGGVADLDAFLEGTEEQLWLYQMNLSGAKSHYRNLSLFATQKYNLLERVTVTDSLGNTTTTGKTLSVSHQLLAERHMKDYFDVVDPENLSTVYNNFYYLDPGTARDSASEDKISNVFQLILGDPDFDRISARAYAGHELRRFGQLSPQGYRYLERLERIRTQPRQLDSIYRDTIEAVFQRRFFNDVFVGGHLAGPTTGTWDWVLDGRYYLLGYYRNDFRVNATFSRSLRDRVDLGLRGSMSLQRPHYFTSNYSSSFFRWENDFPSLFSMEGEAFIRGNEPETDIRAGVTYMSNYIYWNQEALPELYDRDILVFSGSFSRHSTIAGFHSENKILVQYTTAGAVLRLPPVALYTSNYWNQSLFKGALIFNAGVDLYYALKYKANAYMPATGIFYLQDESDVGGYPFLDVFLTFRIARTRFFVSWSNLLSGIMGNNYFTTYRYPMKPRNVRAGLVWTFYD